jgi:hypothetical protein
VDDLSKIVLTTKTNKEHLVPGTVLEYAVTAEAKISGVKIRLVSGEVGYFSLDQMAENSIDLPRIGSILKGELPSPDRIVEDVPLSNYIFNLIRYNIYLVPIVWLSRSITQLLESNNISDVYSSSFKDWVKLPPEHKADKKLISILVNIVKYEGLLGLKRYNDKALI